VEQRKVSEEILLSYVVILGQQNVIVGEEMTELIRRINNPHTEKRTHELDKGGE